MTRYSDSFVIAILRYVPRPQLLLRGVYVVNIIYLVQNLRGVFHKVKQVHYIHHANVQETYHNSFFKFSLSVVIE